MALVRRIEVQVEDREETVVLLTDHLKPAAARMATKSWNGARSSRSSPP